MFCRSVGHSDDGDLGGVSDIEDGDQSDHLTRRTESVGSQDYRHQLAWEAQTEEWTFLGEMVLKKASSLRFLFFWYCQGA